MLHGDTDAGQHLEEKSPHQRYREKELELIKIRNVVDRSRDTIVGLHQSLIQKLSQPNVDTNAVYEEGIKGLDEEIQKKKKDNIKMAQEGISFYIAKNYPPDDRLENSWKNKEVIKERLEEYIKRLEEIGVKDFAIYSAQEDLDGYFMNKRFPEPISFKEFLYSHRKYYYVEVDQALEVIDDIINGIEREPIAEECLYLNRVALYINAYYDNPKVKQYIIDNNILKRLYGLYIDIKDKKDHDGRYQPGFHRILHPVTIIIKHYGNDLWPDIESLHILEHVAETWYRLNKDRSMINIMDIWEAPLTKPDGVTYSELERHTMSADSEVQLFYYGRGEEALADIVVSFSLLEGKREFTLSEVDKLNIVEEVMKRISTKDLTGTRMSSRAYTQSLIEKLSWIYGSELIPVLKNVNLDLDTDEVNLEELRQYGLRDEHIDRDTQYRNGLWWLVENYDQEYGSFWKATSIKGDTGTYLFWPLYNIMRSANEEEKREIFELMRETKFKDKFLAIPADDVRRILFKPYFDEYLRYLKKYGFLEPIELKRSIILGIGAMRGLRDNI